ncbi:MAG: hypothetical protein J0L99_01685 [Chitinophagales bacterium]|nr:hypothetical protein [Chitinophagales bacterium]
MITGNLKTRVTQAIGSNVIAQLVNVIIQIGGVPILIKAWGIERYGEWLLIFSIPAYLGLGDLGIGTVAATEITKSLAKGAEKEATKIFNIGMATSFFSAATLLLLSSIAIISLPVSKYLSNSIPDHEVKITLELLTIYITISILLSLPLSIYRSIGKYSRGQIASSIFRLIEFFTFIILVQNNQTFIYPAAGYLIIRIIYITWISFDLSKQAAWMKLSLNEVNIKSIMKLLPKSISMMFVYLGQTLVSQGLITVIGITLGSVALATFSTVRTLCNFAKQLIGIINLSVFSEFSICISRGDFPTAQKLHTRSVQANIGLTVLATLFLFLVGDTLITFWTKGAISIIQPFFSLYLVYILINSIWIGSWNMLLGCNEHSSLIKQYIGLNILTITLTYFNLNHWGLSNLPVTLILTDVLFGSLVMMKSLSFLRQSYMEFINNIFNIKY